MLIVQGFGGSVEDDAPSGKSKKFHFEQTNFGSATPQVSNVLTHTTQSIRKSGGAVTVDFDVVYLGDCDLQVRLLGMRSGVTDVQLTGRCRAVLTPTLGRVPFVGGLQLCFLSPPKIDFNLKGLADVADWPGVRTKVRRSIMEEVRERYVYPNRITVRTSGQANPEKVHSLMPDGVIFIKVLRYGIEKTTGVIHTWTGSICACQVAVQSVSHIKLVHVITDNCVFYRATGLPKKGNKLRKLLGQADPDPYVRIALGADEHVTSVVKNCQDPEWDGEPWSAFLFGTPRGHMIGLKMYDHDSMSRDEFLGKVNLDAGEVAANAGCEPAEMELALEGNGLGFVTVKG